MKRSSNVAQELDYIYRQRNGLDPGYVVSWAKKHKDSALHGRFTWDDTKAAHAYRLWQARELITEVTIQYQDGKVRQIYVSPVQSRGHTGYASLVDILNNAGRRAAFLQQALEEYERVGDKYHDLTELAGIKRAVSAAKSKARKRPRKAA